MTYIGPTVYKKGDKNFRKNILAVSKRFKGKGGGPESESGIDASKEDIKEGFVWFASDNRDITNLISRSYRYILELHDRGDSVMVKMDAKGFRSCVHAFKVGR